MAKKTVLFITTQLPYPPVSGGIIKSYHLLKFLSEHFNVFLACPLKKGEASHVISLQKKIPLKDVYVKPIDKARSVSNLLKSYVRSASLNVYRNYDAALELKIKSWSKISDLILVDHYEMGAYIPNAFKGKVILHEHNAEYVLWESMAKTLPTSLKKTAVLAEVNRIKKSERAYCQKAHMIWAAPNDIKKLKAIGVKEEKLKKTFHLGNDKLLKLPSLFYRQTNKTILFVGTLTWEANVVGLVWFIKKVFPFILEQEPSVNLLIVGKNPEDRLLDASKGNTNITFKGFVENLEEVYLESSIAIAPLLFGSGMKVKVLEALYRGMPMVTTSVGVEGIAHVNENAIAVSDDPISFAKACVSLINNKEKWQGFSEEGRRVASEYYKWDSLLEKHHKEIEALLNK